MFPFLSCYVFWCFLAPAFGKGLNSIGEAASFRAALEAGCKAVLKAGYKAALERG